MKQLTCEMCGSNDLLKQEGVFVCQTCGTKYSVEEAKKMMVEGTVEVSGTVKVDQSHLIENFLDMARSAIASSNYSEAEQYCNKVIEIDPTNYQAFLYKGTATAWQSTFANIRILETINCWQKAYSNYDDESITEIRSYTDSEFRKIVIAMVNLAGSFVENGINDYKANSYNEHLHSILKCIELYVKSINLTFRMDMLCSEAAISVVPYLVKCSQAEERLYHKIKPSGADAYSDFVKEWLGCIDLLNITAAFGQKSAAKALCYEKAAEVMQTINDLPTYVWSDGRYVPCKLRGNHYESEVIKYRSKAAEAKAKIQSEYWQDHPDEYKAYLKKQEEERERTIKEENEKKKANDEFWTSHSKELQELNADLKELAHQKSSIENNRFNISLLKLIEERTNDIQELIASDRRGKSNFSDDELAVVNGRESFNSKYNALLLVAEANKKQARKKKKMVITIISAALAGLVVMFLVKTSLQNDMENISQMLVADATSSTPVHYEGVYYDGGVKYIYYISIYPYNQCYIDLYMNDTFSQNNIVNSDKITYAISRQGNDYILDFSRLNLKAKPTEPFKIIKEGDAVIIHTDNMKNGISLTLKPHKY